MRKIICFIFAILFMLPLTGVVNAQSSRADSLTALYATKGADTSRVSLALKLANLYELSNADSATKYSRLALALARQLGYKKGIANAMEMVGASLATQASYDSALHYLDRSLQLARRYKLDSTHASKYNHIANVYFFRTRYAEALQYYDSAKRAAKKIQDTDFEAIANSNMASVYFKMGMYARALELYLAGLRIQELKPGNSSITTNYSNIANVYYRLKDYNKALEYLHKVIVINRKHGSYDYIIGNLTTYALIYNDRKMYDSSLHYLGEAQQLATQLNDPYILNIVKGNIAECYLNMNDLARADELYKESLQLSAKIGDNEGLAFAKAGIGSVLIKQGKAAEGRTNLQEALSMFQKQGIMEQAMDVAGKLAASYEQDGDFKNALHYHKIKTAFTDSIGKSTTRQNAEQLIFDYELQKKEAKIDLLEKDKLIAEATNKNQQTFLWAISVGMLLSIIIAFLFYWNVHAMKKNRILILAQKDEIEKQAMKLSELNDFKDNTFSVLAHDLRSPVNALTGTMMMLDEEIITPKEFIEHKQELSNKLQAVTMLLDNMLYWAKSQMKGENTLEIEQLDIKEKVARGLAVLKDAAAQKSIIIQNKVPENIYAFADRSQVDIVIRNILANAIKFTHEGGEITATAHKDTDNAYISIMDTGVGMTSDQVANLFKADVYASTRGTLGEKGTGLGLQLCYDIIKKNGGDIQVKSAPGLGSTFIIILPAVNN